MWLVFLRLWCWHAPRRGNMVTLRFREGAVRLVTRAQARDALAVGAARRATKEEIADERRRVAA
jgi:hypothetical protein